MGRPRLEVDENAITTAYAAGASINALANTHGVDRQVIRRVLREEGDNVLQFPTRDGIHVPPGHITSAEVLDRAGVTYRQLDYWTRAGMLHPTNGDQPGTGNPRFYPTSEIPIACLMRDLLAAGLTPRAAHRAARDLVDHGHTLLAGIRIDLPEDL